MMGDFLFMLEAVVDATGGKFVGPTLDREVAGVSIDTRTLSGGDLFAALPGENTDGHDFLKEAFAAGACCALIKQSVWETVPLEIKHAGSFILVSDPLKGLQDLARWYLRRFSSLAEDCSYR